ncbi:PAS domain S-box-containing protein/diguanylate cyclase (GGDEF) domain-containing protein [Mesobacillus persicus]|uniref:PAS domain S-box-containing protein/diguanylate cyclase (GGDEF) domain-containing protein n=1 Tax=Mesobacillus persicus TaxID=930146 RepID=A0A1H8CPM3_9BACI|nr:GGDEF and EAL domain-containing protein [Mesobacillus persicus]SEM97201.1 PAS domain S-box-containing protein/diguanylate cyclase (GGDEF) domain-containing protein [Mesobacillus persicus]
MSSVKWGNRYVIYAIGILVLSGLLDLYIFYLSSMPGKTPILFKLVLNIVVLFIFWRLISGINKYEAELQGNRKRLKNIFDTLDVAIWSHDLKTDALLITTGIEKLYGYSSDYFYQDHELWKKVILPDDAQVLAEREKKLAQGEPVTSEYRIIRADGEVRWIQDRGIPSLNQLGELVDFNSVLFDITDRKESEGLYHSLVEMSSDLVAVYSRGKLDYINEAGCKLFKADNQQDLIGQPISKLIPSNILTQLKLRQLSLDENTEEKMSFEFMINDFDGQKIDLEMTAVPILYEGRMAEQIVGRNISQRKQAEETIRRMAYYDVLTDLPNRYLFRRQLSAALSEIGDQFIAILFLDLDRFKIINDTKGHFIGDQLLKVVATKLEEAVNLDGMVARNGGDEFIVLLENTNREKTEEVAQRILDQFSQGMDVAGQDFYVTTSIGISLAPVDGEDEETLLKHADTAMYLAKDRGKNNYQFYTNKLQELSLWKLEIENGLRKALENHQFELHFQPQFEMETGMIVGVEALVRWQHPDKGLVSPAEFISLAEETGLIVPLGYWVLKEACLQNKRWQNSGYNPMVISVNVSVRQLQNENFVEMVKDILCQTNLDPCYLELEITESMMLTQESSTSLLKQLNELGVSVAIDDFGTGYSSLCRLKQLPIDRIKIDKSFVDDIDHHPNQGAMVKTIIDMGHNLGFRVIAEGIETQAQADFLMKHECLHGQGYYFSKPLPAVQVEKLFN